MAMKTQCEWFLSGNFYEKKYHKRYLPTNNVLKYYGSHHDSPFALKIVEFSNFVARKTLKIRKIAKITLLASFTNSKGFRRLKHPKI